MQFRSHCRMSELIFGHTYLAVMRRWVAQIPGWESECTVWNIAWRNLAGTNGRGRVTDNGGSRGGKRYIPEDKGSVWGRQ